MRIREKFGDFWWWSLCLFVAARSGDLINAFVGLWLVPKYVPQEELGAVLPLLQVTSVFGLPISILVFTFTKFLNEYHTKGEAGKVKALIRAFWGWTVVAVVVGTGAALLLLPHFFERIRVQSGSLGLLIILAAVTTTVAPMFNNALQGMKKFRECTIIGLFVAPIRLVVMLVAMPFRALSGYMLGQTAPSLLSIGWSWFALRKEIGSGVKPVAFAKQDGLRMLKYAGFVTLACLGGVVLGIVQPLVIRQRLPEVESAAYYVISRFAEIATYLGQTMLFILFPFAAEAQVKSKNAVHLMYKSMVAVFFFGLACAFAFSVFGGWFLGLSPVWSPYAPYASDMSLLAVLLTIGAVNGVFFTFEGASSRFAYLWYAIPISLFNAASLVCLMGFSFFRGKLPNAVVDWMERLDVATLRNYLWINIAFAILLFVSTCVHLLIRWHRGRNLK